MCDKPASDKESKLCYFIAPIKREISQPFKNGLPVDKICDRLKKKNSEICSLRFVTASLPEATAATDFSKLKIKQLKGIMLEKGLSCPDCLEKSDYVAFLERHFGKKAEL